MFGQRKMKEMSSIKRDLISLTNDLGNQRVMLSLDHVKLEEEVATERDRVNEKFTNHGITLWRLKRGLGNVYKKMKGIRAWLLTLDRQMGNSQAKLDQQQVQINKLVGTLDKWTIILDRLCDVVAEARKRDAAECAQGSREIKAIKAILDYLGADMNEDTFLVTARKPPRKGSGLLKW